VAQARQSTPGAAGAPQEGVQGGRVEEVSEGAILQWLDRDHVKVVYRTAQDLRAALWHLVKELKEGGRLSVRDAGILLLILYDTKRVDKLVGLAQDISRDSGVTVELEKARRIPKHLRPSQGT